VVVAVLGSDLPELVVVVQDSLIKIIPVQMWLSTAVPDKIKVVTVVVEVVVEPAQMEV
jgi:hypothetical protein